MDSLSNTSMHSKVRAIPGLNSYGEDILIGSKDDGGNFPQYMY